MIILVIDQFRGDYLDRYRDALTAPNGFNLFLKRGAYFNNCYFQYANTKTAPGHATIGTGAYTDGHSISSNEWWDLARNTDRPISSVEDERYHGWWGTSTICPGFSLRRHQLLPIRGSALRRAICARPRSEMSFGWPLAGESKRLRDLAEGSGVYSSGRAGCEWGVLDRSDDGPVCDQLLLHEPASGLGYGLQ